MKKAFSLIIITISFIACSKKEAANEDNLTPEQEQIALGKQAFDNYGCAACHHSSNKIIGPSLNLISKTYKEQGTSVYDFLKMKSEPIVDTNESMVSIMKNNLETTTAKVPEEELQAIVTYIESLSK